MVHTISLTDEGEDDFEIYNNPITNLNGEKVGKRKVDAGGFRTAPLHLAVASTERVHESVPTEVVE